MTRKFNKNLVFKVYPLFFAFAIIVPLAINFVSDWLWFGEVGFTKIFATILSTKLLLFVISSGLIFIILYSNHRFLKSRSKRNYGRPITIQLSEDRGPINISDNIDKLFTIAFSLVAILFGLMLAGSWQTVLEFINASKFTDADPIFSKNIGYYFFTLPLIQTLINTAFFLLIITVIASTLYFVAKEMIYLNKFNSRPTLDSFVKNYLFSLLAVLFLLVSAHIYFISLPELLYSQNGQFLGANYADVYGSLPILTFLAGIAIVGAILVVLNSRRDDNKLAFAAVGLFAIVSIAGGVYPELLQRFIVNPNEFSKEKSFISHNIKGTRKAWNIDDVKIRDLKGEKELAISDLQKNDSSIKNIRLWDREPLLDTFGQIQEIRTYYDFVSIDNDRYLIDGEYRQVMLSARELNSESLPNRTFINEQLVFTHGMGLALGPVNQVTNEGLPVLFIKDLPPSSTSDKLKVGKPEIYFGELSSSPVISNTKTKEFNYPSGDKNVFTNYKGDGGIHLDSFAKKLFYAIKFGKLPILLSDDVTAESKIMYHRNIKERARKAFPFLNFDNDPYLVIDRGGLKWIYDAYTTSNRYPYSQTSMYGNEPINYMRNSAKLVIDAYDGTIDAYIADKNDPMINTYSKIFPGVFKQLDDMPQSLKEHLRYPEDIFAHQASLYSVYHMEKAPIFYNKEDQWEIPLIGEGNSIDPIMRHMIMKLPEEQREEFILMIPFTPRQKDNLSAWLAARSDGDNYGKLVVYRFPKQSLVFGPKQIMNRINQDAEISRQVSLWDQRGSQVIRGNLLVIPIEESLLYVQPLYLRAEGGKIPELKRVIVAYKNNIAMEDTLEKSIQHIFGGSLKADNVGKQKETRERVNPDPEENGERADLIKQAQEHYEKALDAQRKGDWSTYGEEIEKLGKVLKKLEQ